MLIWLGFDVFVWFVIWWRVIFDVSVGLLVGFVCVLVLIDLRVGLCLFICLHGGLMLDAWFVWLRGFCFWVVFLLLGCSGSLVTIFGWFPFVLVFVVFKLALIL